MDDYGSISDEAMPAASGTYVGEATRPLILVVAAQDRTNVNGADVVNSETDSQKQPF